MGIAWEQRRKVVIRAAGCCEYCLSPSAYSPDTFSVDHVVPRSRGGTDSDANLALACQGCNSRKFTATTAIDPLTGQEVQLYDPRTQGWFEHFAWSDNYLLIEGITPVGRATVARLKLNRNGVVGLRRLVRQTHEHPPRR